MRTMKRTVQKKESMHNDTPAGQVHCHAQQSAAVTPQVSLLALAIFGGASGTEATRLMTLASSLIFSPHKVVQNRDGDEGRYYCLLVARKVWRVGADENFRDVEDCPGHESIHESPHRQPFFA